MIINLPDTSTREIAKQLVQLRESGSQATTGRVLSLIVVVSSTKELPQVLAAVNDSSREHPSRVLVMISSDYSGPSRVDAEIRVGGDTGASEVIVMKLSGDLAGHKEALVTPLLLPDTPIVAWWPSAAPINLAEDPIGRIAQRRITDALNDPPEDSLYRRRTHYAPGDSDLSWSRLTPWRGVLASALDQPPQEKIESVNVYGPAGSPCVDLAAGWLADRLSVPIVREATGDDRIPVDADGKPCHSVTKVELHRAEDSIVVEVLDADTLSVSVPNRPVSLVALGRRSNSDSLAEELRHLDADKAYARALRGLSRVRYAEN